MRARSRARARNRTERAGAGGPKRRPDGRAPATPLEKTTMRDKKHELCSLPSRSCPLAVLAPREREDETTAERSDEGAKRWVARFPEKKRVWRRTSLFFDGEKRRNENFSFVCCLQEKFSLFASVTSPRSFSLFLIGEVFFFFFASPPSAPFSESWARPRKPSRASRPRAGPRATTGGGSGPSRRRTEASCPCTPKRLPRRPSRPR